jgi:hypothetical protein
MNGHSQILFDWILLYIDEDEDWEMYFWTLARFPLFTILLN